MGYSEFDDSMIFKTFGIGLWKQKKLWRKDINGINRNVLNWLVVSTHLKNISQNGNLPPHGGENKKWLKPPPVKFVFVLHSKHNFLLKECRQCKWDLSVTYLQCRTGFDACPGSDHRRNGFSWIHKIISSAMIHPLLLQAEMVLRQISVIDNLFSNTYIHSLLNCLEFKQQVPK